MLFSVAIFAFENEQLANYKAIIAVFSVFIFHTTSLCAQRSSKKCTSIACWTARFFYPQGVQCARTKKALQKNALLYGRFAEFSKTLVCYF